MSLNPCQGFWCTKDSDEDKQLGELQGHTHVFPGNMASFISIVVPSCCSEIPKPVSRRAFSKYTPPKGKRVKSYAALLSGLRATISSFPDDKKPKFFPLRRKELPFPFPEFSHGYTTTPDLAISFPGDTSAVSDWQKTAMFIHVKGNRSDDPFEQSDPLMDSEHSAAVVQLAIGARALMAVHGHCAVFVLGIYATTCRIIRFDHVCAIASPAFSLKRHPEHLQRFFWQLSNPDEAAVSGAIVGFDPTVRRLTLVEQVWLVDSLQAAGHAAPPNLAMCRRVQCEGTHGGTAVVKAYFTVGFIDINPLLTSQATVVWRAVEDPRTITSGRSTALPEVDGNVSVVVVKDSWRRLGHRSEQDFFDRIEEAIPECERIGLPAYIVGCDLGDAAVRRWMTISPCELPEAIEATRSQLEDESASESASPAVPVLAMIPANSPPLPLQQTCTCHLFHGTEGVKSERSHMRSVTSTVGRPITEFKDTRQLCQAIRDAIAAHKSLWKGAEILHRDISPGNILIADADPCKSGVVGFLHDFHHSSMVGGGVERLATFESDRGVEYDTYYFMATELLESPEGRNEVDHDLESFFWVLLWVVLRHTKHSYVQGEEECTTLFGTGPNFDVDYATHKRGYLLAFSSDVTVWNNRPLTELLRDFRLCCGKSIWRPSESSPRMTHDQVLAIFDYALKQDDWPSCRSHIV